MQQNFAQKHVAARRCSRGSTVDRQPKAPRAGSPLLITKPEEGIKVVRRNDGNGRLSTAAECRTGGILRGTQTTRFSLLVAARATPWTRESKTVRGCCCTLLSRGTRSVVRRVAGPGLRKMASMGNTLFRACRNDAFSLLSLSLRGRKLAVINPSSIVMMIHGYVSTFE
jgi:hypothetical protein